MGESKIKKEQFRAIGRCVYCGKDCKPTADHVPPKSLFPKPRPQDLITVPACKKCNEGAAELDAEFKAAVGLQIDPRNGKINGEFVASTHRTLAKSALAKKMFNGSKSVYIEQDGMYLPSRTFNWSVASHDRTIERIVRGLYFKETREILINIGAGVEVYFFNNANGNLIDLAHTLVVRVVGNGAFAYAVGIDKADPRQSVWFLQFYDTHLAGAKTFVLGS